MLSHRVICFHGFWGYPTDFDFLKNTIPNLEAVDLKIHNGKNLKQWTEFFQQEYFRNGPVSFVGYSQGGRLILEGLRSLPTGSEDKIKKIILLSTGVVFSDRPELERLSRQAGDLNWAGRFQSDSTEDLWRDWNSQEVFAGSKNEISKKKLHNEERQFLFNCLTKWSVSEQAETFSVLKGFKSKIEFLVGENDQKYIYLLKRLIKEAKDLQHVIVSQAGHRLCQDQVKTVAEIIYNSLRS